MVLYKDLNVRLCFIAFEVDNASNAGWFERTDGGGVWEQVAGR